MSIAEIERLKQMDSDIIDYEIERAKLLEEVNLLAEKFVNSNIKEIKARKINLRR